MAHGFSATDMDDIYWSDIDKYHLRYLNAEESPQKITEKKKLESVIKCFLGRIPHNRKFNLPTTAQVFHRSIYEVNDFSIVKMENAWTVIERYAHNLISQPWRKEFHKIQLYSGYYEHNVNNILVGGEQLLIYMGYVLGHDGALYLDGPVDPDRVAPVSKDCFIASTECKVMFQIYSEMVSRSNHVTYEDIFHFREQNICDINKAIFELSSPHQRTNIYPPMAYGASGCTKNNPYQSNQVKEPINPLYWCTGQYLPNDPHSYNTCSTNPTNLLPHYVYPTNGCSYPIASRSYYQGMTGHESNTVPTGRLLEFEPSSFKNSHNEKSHKRNISELLRHERYGSTKEDHLYRNSKDIQNWIQRDVEDDESDRSSIAQRVCEEMMQVQLDDYPSRSTKDTKKKEKKIVSRESTSAHLNSTRNMSDRGLSDTDSAHKPSIRPKSNKVTNNAGAEAKWKCLACTFLNVPSAGICEMCNKSRIQGNESIPLISGGRNCDSCTLVNDRGEEKCRVCGKSLKDSSTYI